MTIREKQRNGERVRIRCTPRDLVAIVNDLVEEIEELKEEISKLKERKNDKV